MPSVPMVMPSLIAMVLNSMGVPPASRTPRFTCSASRRRLKLHGMVSVQVLAMPTIGRARSASEKPIALKYERAGARSRPSRRVWLLWRGSSDMGAHRSVAWSRGEARGAACPPRPPVLRGLRGGEPGRDAPDRARAVRAAPGRGEGRAPERVRADPISRAARARGVAAAAGEAAAHDGMAAAPPGATRVERVPAGAARAHTPPRGASPPPREADVRAAVLPALRARTSPWRWYPALYVRVPQTLRCTPAIEGGVTQRLWPIEDMVGLVDERETASQREAT